jgi:transcriptional regulator with XRE-family HTH domain
MNRFLLPTEIKRTREALGLSQGDFATFMETSQPTLSDIEAGRRLPPPRFVMLLEALKSGWRPSRGWPPTGLEAKVRRARRRQRDRA